jgi:hypothetical protein
VSLLQDSPVNDRSNCMRSSVDVKGESHKIRDGQTRRFGRRVRQVAFAVWDTAVASTRGMMDAEGVG